MWANTGFLNRSLFTFYYQKSLPDGEFQHDAIQNQVYSEYDLVEKYNAALMLDAIRKLVAPESFVFRMLLSPHFRYIQEKTQTLASVKENSIYPIGKIDYEQQTVSDFIPLPEGIPFQFNSNFTYQEITLPILNFKDNPMLIPIKGRLNGKDFLWNIPIGRILLGYAYWEYERPFSTNYFSLNNQSVVYHARLKAKGLVFVFEPYDPGSPGLHIGGVLAMGLNNSVKSNFDWKQMFEQHGSSQSNVSTSYKLSRIEISARYILPISKKGIRISFGANLSKFDFTINEYQDTNGENKTLTELKNPDAFYKLEASLSYRF